MKKTFDNHHHSYEANQIRFQLKSEDRILGIQIKHIYLITCTLIPSWLMDSFFVNLTKIPLNLPRDEFSI